MENNSEFIKYINLHKMTVKAYNDYMKTTAKRCGISKLETDVLVFLYNNSDCISISDVVKSGSFSEEKVYSAFEQLTEHKLIERISNSEKRIEITGKGGIICKSLNETRLKFLNSITNDITSEEMSVFDKICDKITDNLTTK